ncbi:MAG: hypothetical protein H0T62_14735 [Parachlamydiaceae bacterium]|nr:hypothetical protein [Parachlamydiaceae bacterium]
MSFISNDFVAKVRRDVVELVENCGASAIGGAVLALAATALKITIFAANPLGAAVLCATVALGTGLTGKIMNHLRLDENDPAKGETNRHLNKLIEKICFGVQMAIWLTAASFAASYMGVPLIAGTFIVLGAMIPVEIIRAGVSWYNSRKPEESVVNVNVNENADVQEQTIIDLDADLGAKHNIDPQHGSPSMSSNYNRHDVTNLQGRHSNL